MKYQLFTYAAHDAGAEGAAGMAVAGRHVDLSAAAQLAGLPGLAGLRIDDLVARWNDMQVPLRRTAALIAQGADALAMLNLATLRFRAPLARPGVIYGAGANYRDHVEAMGRAFGMRLVLDPKAEGVAPWHFIKAGQGTLAAHGEAVRIPPGTLKLDWEAELAVVIGTRASRVTVDAALDHVAGYTCANDLSARDHLVRAPVDAGSPFRFDWVGHKSFTGACPLGPYLTPAEFVASPETLGIKLWLNGALQQDSCTDNHLYGVAEQIAYLSERIDLMPGDILLTGTPAGVGMEKGVFLQPGDVTRVWIEGLGELETTIA